MPNKAVFKYFLNHSRPIFILIRGSNCFDENLSNELFRRLNPQISLKRPSLIISTLDILHWWYFLHVYNIQHLRLLAKESKANFIYLQDIKNRKTEIIVMEIEQLYFNKGSMWAWKQERTYYSYSDYINLSVYLCWRSVGLLFRYGGTIKITD